jgi:heterodisulfide reductase subunit A-like polyferredoxin
MGKKIKIGKKVVVIGGGNVAVDVARSSLRIGGEEIHLVCVESREEMPAFDYEIEEAEQEGIVIHTRRMPKRIVGEKGKAVGVETLECTSVFDDEGRFNPQMKPKTESIIEADTIIVAIGQEVDYTLLKAADGVLVTKRGLLEVDPVTMQTNVPNIYAGGDAVFGPGLVIEAIAQGHEAATSIDRYLRGEDLYEKRAEEEKIVAPLPERKVEKQPRLEIPKMQVNKRIQCFEEVELELTEELAIKEAQRCMYCNNCSMCKQCVEACEADAIDHEMKDKMLEFNVGSIILAPGYDKFDARIKGEYGYGRYKNVLTSLEFERILSASGPYQGHVVRLSDEKEPKKIAWINCVGSRDLQCGNNYCSSVCCTYAIKEAVISKEHVSTIEPTIFYMDMRTFGKGFDAYYERAKDQYGVRFIRCRVSEVQEDPVTKNLRIRFEDEDGKLKDEEFDMVVLSVGFEPKDKVKELAEKLDVKLNDYGFCQISEFSPVESTRPGVYVCGAFSGPKDIPETVMEASGAAAKASGLIAEGRNSLIVKKEYPPEIDVSGQDPRIGVFICNCGINIGGYLDVPSVVDYAKSLPNVAYAEDNLYTCSQDTQNKIVEKIKEHNLNRVIVASCTPRTHEPLFRETIREAGLNQYLFEMANIRDQCSWVHMKEPEKATAKAKDLVRIAIAKARLLEPLPVISVDVIQKGLVVGGGLSGMTSALAIADQGFDVFLIEKDKELGGNLRNIYYTLENDDIQDHLRSMIAKVESNPRIKVLKNAQVENIEGYVGNYVTTVANGAAKMKLEHGIIVVATGAEESKPKEYLYGEDERVITQRELEKQLAEGQGFGKKTVVMIQCVGSRDDEHPYCSRVCCTDAIKNALMLKEKNPESQVFVLYRDMRTYGFREAFYEKARENGVIFICYDLDGKPEVVKGNGGLEVAIRDPIIQDKLLINADVVVLSPAIVSCVGNEDLAKQLKVPLNEDGFFLEAHVKLRPVDFATEGVFLAGMAHSPKSIGESVSQAYAAASRACVLLSQGSITIEPIVAAVDEEKCIGCGLCVSLCSFGAKELQLKEGGRKAETILASCKGCGLCGASCPQHAITMQHFTIEMITAQIEALGEAT